LSINEQTLFVVLCSFLSISGRAKKTISSKKKGQSHAHDFDPDDPNLAPDLSEDVLTTESSMAGGASNQVNEDDESDYEINVLAYDGSHRQYSAEKYGRARNSYQCDLENGA